MALRDRNTSTGKLNKRRVGRSSDREAGLFDLRAEPPAADRTQRGADGEIPDRPWRERHRVEVVPGDSAYGYGRGTKDPDPDRSPGLIGPSGTSSGGRLVRGNTPGRRISSPVQAGGQTGGRISSPAQAGGQTGGRIPAPSVSSSPAADRQTGRRELSADLIGGRRSAGRTFNTRASSASGPDRTRTGFGNAGNRNGRTDLFPGADWTRDDRRQASSPYGRRSAEPVARQGQQQQRQQQQRQQHRQRSGTGLPAGNAPVSYGNDRRAGTFSGGRPYDPYNAYGTNANDPFDPYDEYDEFAPDPALDEEVEEARDQAGRRRRQSARARRQREQELRGMYIKAGIGIAAVLLILIVVLPRTLFRKRTPAPEPAAATASAQTDAQAGEGQEQTAGDPDTPDAGGEKADTSDPEPEDPGTPEAGADTEPGLTGGPGKEETGEEPAEEDAAPQITASPEEPAEGADESPAGAGEETASDDTQGGQNAAGGTASDDTQGGQNAGGTASDDTQGGQEKEPAEGTGEAQAASGPAAAGTDGHTYAHQDDWRLILVNPWNKLPEGHTVETTSLINGEQVDSRCYNDLTRMLSDCAAVRGCSPIVCSSYRPHEKQVALFEAQIKSEMASGKSREEAEEAAGTVVAVPGTSEHELGLAVDICDEKYQNLDDAQEDTPTQQWLMQHCWEYGFILRYPPEKQQITGIIYEPWHYRYVGLEAAKAMQQSGQCLEEYLQAD